QTPLHARCALPLRLRLSGRGALRRGIDGIQRLARSHEQAVALGSAEAHVAANLGQPNPSDELALRRPHGHPVVTDAATGIARAPQIAVDVSAYAVGPALHTVDHEAGEQLAVGKLVVGA